jgi:hypothetical protein
MLIRTQTSRPAERKAVVLLVVISLLTLFAIVALSFLLYANAEANASKLFREAEANDIAAAGLSPEKLLSIFLTQFIYDVPDDNTGVYSALRGHSLSRGIYGRNYDPTNTTVVPNQVPFNGTGRLHTSPGSFMNPFSMAPFNTPMDDFLLVNYTYFRDDAQLKPPNTPSDMTFLRDPERLGMRATLAAPVGPYTGGFNAPYTYPDLNNMYLAAMKADGTVLMPSFHRHWLFNPTNQLNDQSNPNWTNAQGKYMTLRPRPIDNDPQNFPYPEDPGGDVRNLPPGLPGYLDPISGKNANNDSIWMDLGAPVMTDKHGKKFKPLFAPLILDLDNRINLNIAGNVRGNNATATTTPPPSPLPPPHVSNQGWGPWEMNLGLVLNNPGSGNLPEWTNLFFGNGGYGGRYGLQTTQPCYPGSSFRYSAGGGDTPHFYGQVDFDGCDEVNQFRPSIAMTLPVPPSAPGSFTSFPTYNNPATTGGYGNGVPMTPPPPPPPPLTPGPLTFYPDEHYLHPLLYNYFQPDLGLSTNMAFPISNMDALLRFGDVNSSGLTSDLLRLCPTSLQGVSQQPATMPTSTALIRHLVTTHSFDVDWPGLSPWAIPPMAGPAPGTANYTLNPATSLLPTGPTAGFPPLAARPAGSGEFSASDWRAINAALGRINLNRNLTPYSTSLAQATLDRQQFAADIFVRLVLVTGAYDLYNPPTPVSPLQFNALRWLAQLSANIVDFIDTDDVMTPFNWAWAQGPGPMPGTTAPNPTYQNYPQFLPAINQFQTAALTMDTTTVSPGASTGWVFGTELPRVVVNEAYAQSTQPGPPVGTGPFIVTVKVELHNPFNQDPRDPPTVHGAANLATATIPVYQLLLTKSQSTSASLRAPANSLGNPTPPGPTGEQYTTTIGGPTNSSTTFPAGTTIPPCQGLATTGYFVVDPTVPMSPYANLTYQVAAGTTPVPAPTILLQRAANPQAPAIDATPYTTVAPGVFALNPTYNPYVTVDYMEGNGTTPFLVYDSMAGTRNSFGRPQPYAGLGGLLQTQTGAATTPPNNSFGQYNQGPAPPGTPAVNNGNPFNWLTHLDRQVISPMELLQVSGYKPHELTQQFISPGSPLGPFADHRAPWFDEDLPPGSGTSHLLWRLFEFLETNNRAAGMSPGGRLPGKVNLNNVWDVETFQAMADPQNSNSFSLGTGDLRDVTTIFQNLVASRSPQGYPGANDVPFAGMAAAFTAPMDVQYPQGSGIGRTLLRPPPGTPSPNQNALLQVPANLITPQ